ncbi:RNA polymerase subunit sigma-70 [Cryobacterium sp. Y82]|uniref:helix-turn-helix domain-containing protein n=1 Tax=Cryobacterium sp. Y82 TaxID=2045017 RepID=UPI000CE353EC|nr:RNA polymerase subunit sigma-70 [Cryobacterium sp. Y82]
MFVVASPEHASALLDAGKLGCPGGAGALRPHGYGRIRRVRSLGHTPVTVRPRRARCFSCAVTHVLLPAGLVLRWADTVEVIGTALAAKARGDGRRTIAARLDRPASTVRRWLCRARGPHADWLYEQGVQHAYRADPDILNHDVIWPTALGDALNLLAGAALACQQRWDSPLPVWTLIGLFTRGRLLPPPLRI